MARSPSPDLPRPGEREITAAGHCTARLRACAYASELSFYLISAAAATLSRRLARAALYSLLPSRSGCAPPLLPCTPRLLSRAYTHTSSLSLHLLYFVFPPLSVSQSRSLLSLSFFPYAPISPLHLSFLFLPFSSFSPVSFFLSTSFPYLREFPSHPSPFYGVFASPHRHQHSLFKRSPQI